MKRYNPKMFKENQATKQISTFEDIRFNQAYLGESHIRVTMKGCDDGEWVRYKDVAKLVVRLTQGNEWNSLTLTPVTGKDCIVMLITGEKHPAEMGKDGWKKLAGYMYDFNKQDIIKWRYDETI